MSKPLILNASQANAVAQIISNANNVGVSDGRLCISGGKAQEDIILVWHTGVEIRVGAIGSCREHYWCQDDFFAAYGLDGAKKVVPTVPDTASDMAKARKLAKANGITIDRDSDTAYWVTEPYGLNEHPDFQDGRFCSDGTEVLQRVEEIIKALKG